MIDYEHAFGVTGLATRNFKIPAFATVEYTVKLNEFENDHESLVQANIFKLAGTGMYNQKNYSAAELVYNQSISFLDDCSKFILSIILLLYQINRFRYFRRHRIAEN